MTTTVEIVNRALQAIGTRTTIASLSEASNEAIQANLIFDQLRQDLLRMAPWGCATNFANLTYITSSPGTPENQTAATATWQRGQPAPPWLYEYQYPADCFRALRIVPQFSTGLVGGVSLTPLGVLPSYFSGPPVRFQISVDQLWSAGSATVAVGGAGYAVLDQITLAGTPAGLAPIGAPAVLQVATLGGGGAVATANILSSVHGTNLAGSYFNKPTNPVAQGSTTGAGLGATFNLDITITDQRVILTNQPQAILCYVRDVSEINVMDPEFLDAWVKLLASRLVIALTGDKALANLKLAEVNASIMQARKDDANEGLTINDVTPDWIRVRGINYPDWGGGWGGGVDWGGLFPYYG